MYFLFPFLQLISETPIWHLLQVLFIYLLYSVSCLAAVFLIFYNIFSCSFAAIKNELKEASAPVNLPLRHRRLENSSWLTTW